MKPIVTLPEGVKDKLKWSSLFVCKTLSGNFVADLAGAQESASGDTPEEAIANLEEQLWKRAAISEK